MCLFAVFVVLSAVSVANIKAESYSFTLTKNDTDIFVNCVNEIGLSEKEIADARNRDHKYLEDEKFKCLHGCLYKASKVIKDDGEIDADAAVKYYHVENIERLKNIIIECVKKNLKGDNDCETAHTLFSCIRAPAKQ